MTALELLKQRLLKDQEESPLYNQYINGILYHIDNELLEMEKQQIINAHLNGQAEFDTGPYRSEIIKHSEQYYNEKFNK